MRSANHLYETLADLLEYPGGDWDARVRRAMRADGDEMPGFRPRLLVFSRRLAGIALTTLQERYTQTFDLNPVCSLDAGYHLFGENYKRGLFLANLRETESPFDLGQEHQLPDYLPVLLRLVVRLEDEELRADLIAECMIPALEKMIETLKQTDNPYGDLLEVAYEALKAEVPGRQPARAADFTNGDAIPELYRISSRAADRLTTKAQRHEDQDRFLTL